MAWTCRRQTNKIKCGQKNSWRRQKCVRCGGRRPARRKPAHMAALEIPYSEYVRINGGEFCGICGARPKRGSRKQRLDRDHAHEGTGYARGVLCSMCNFRLKTWMTSDWLRKAANYLDRTADR